MPLGSELLSLAIDSLPRNPGILDFCVPIREASALLLPLRSGKCPTLGGIDELLKFLWHERNPSAKTIKTIAKFSAFAGTLPNIVFDAARSMRVAQLRARERTVSLDGEQMAGPSAWSPVVTQCL
jgi:hypothetical protein